MIRFQFVYDHRTEYSVKRMCHVLKLNRSSFYKWVNTRDKRRLKTCSDALIGARIKTIFEDEHGLYCQMRVFGTGVLGTRYCRVPSSWYRAEGCVGPDGLQFQGGITASRLHR